MDFPKRLQFKNFFTECLNKHTDVLVTCRGIACYCLSFQAFKLMSKYFIFRHVFALETLLSSIEIQVQVRFKVTQKILAETSFFLVFTDNSRQKIMCACFHLRVWIFFVFKNHIHMFTNCQRVVDHKYITFCLLPGSLRSSENGNVHFFLQMEKIFNIVKKATISNFTSTFLLVVWAQLEGFLFTLLFYWSLGPEQLFENVMQF